MKSYLTKTFFCEISLNSMGSLAEDFDRWTNKQLNDNAINGYELERLTNNVIPLGNGRIYAYLTIVMSKEA